MPIVRDIFKQLVPAKAVPALGAMRRIFSGQRAVFPVDVPLVNYGNDDPDINGENFLLRAYASTWATCFDVGANRGHYTDAIRRFNPRCHITSFEPTPSLVKKMQDRAHSCDDRWRIVGKALGDVEGEVTFNLNLDHDDHSSIHLVSEATTAIKIAQTTLDTYCENSGIDFVDFVKIDTEGNDVNVIKGAKKLIAEQRIGMMQVEYGSGYKNAGTSLKELFELLSPTYAMFHLEPTGLLPTTYHDSFEFYWYCNWVAISYEYFHKIHFVNTTRINGY